MRTVTSKIFSNYTLNLYFFIHLRALPAWVALAREKRAKFST